MTFEGDILNLEHVLKIKLRVHLPHFSKANLFYQVFRQKKQQFGTHFATLLKQFCHQTIVIITASLRGHKLAGYLTRVRAVIYRPVFINN